MSLHLPGGPDPRMVAASQQQREAAVHAFIGDTAQHLYARFLGDLAWAELTKNDGLGKKDFSVTADMCRDAAAKAKAAAPFLGEAFGMCNIRDPEMTNGD